MKTRTAWTFALAGLLAVPALALVPAAMLARAGADEGATSPVTDAQIDAWIAELDDDAFETRTRAYEKLRAIGARAATALRKAMKEDDSEEVRWRAEQLLLRLKGVKRAPLDRQGPDKRDDESKPKRDSNLGWWRRGLMDGEDIFKSLREHMKKLDEQFKQLDRQHAKMFSREVAVPGLRLKKIGIGKVELRVSGEAGTTEARTYSGTSLNDILASHPELENHARMGELKEKVKGQFWTGFSDFADAFDIVKGLGTGSNMGISIDKDGRVRTHTVTVTHTDKGVKVKIREKGTDGEEKITELEGESLEAIKRDHPELKQKLGGMRIHFSAPQLFLNERDNLLRRLDPFTGRRLLGRTTPAKPRFGFVAERVSESLVSQLGLGTNEGVVITKVVPDSAAAKIGLLPYDILLAVNGSPVRSLETVREMMADKIDPSTPLELQIIRRAQRETLSR